MAQTPGSNSQEERRRSFRGLLFWLGLLPVILGSLFCCAQLALLAVPGRDWSADTRSRLVADYLPWEYQKIPALKLAELIQDIQRDELNTGTPMAVVTAVYWVPPTPTSTAISVAITTGTPNTRATSTSTFEARFPTNSPTANATATATRPIASTNTLTPQPFTATLSPTASRTPTLPPPPTKTNTPQPRPSSTKTPVTPSRTPTRTPVTPSATLVTPSATPVTPSATPVTPSATPITPSPTFTPITPTPTFTPETPTPTFTPETPTFTPTYAPVRPIAENDGLSTSVPGGCLASFGYRNDNPQPVHIEIGPLNQISDDTATITPFQPTDFLVGRISGAFQVFWNSGGPILWSLDGRLASVAWCSSPTPAAP